MRKTSQREKTAEAHEGESGGDTAGGIQSSTLLLIVALSSSVPSTIKVKDDDDNNNGIRDNPRNLFVDSPVPWLGKESELQREPQGEHERDDRPSRVAERERRNFSN